MPKKLSGLFETEEALLDLLCERPMEAEEMAKVLKLGESPIRRHLRIFGTMGWATCSNTRPRTWAITPRGREKAREPNPRVWLKVPWIER